MIHLSRRRFLSISAACAALPTSAATAPTARWRGTALGAAASLRLEGLTDAQAAPIVNAIETEVARLEGIFSLYRPESELSRLNRDGHLFAPAPELLTVLSLCTALHDASDGAFDPSIQPVWYALATGASASEVRSAREATGWHNVSIETAAIRLPQPGVSALTLNGIAQGAITDRIAALLRSFDLHDVLVDMGEIAAMGQRMDGRQWRVGLAGPEGSVQKHLSLRDRAVATSAPEGTLLGSGQGHILNPNGSNPFHKTLSISAPQAVIADGLSTALCLVPHQQVDAVLRNFPDAKLELLI
ncbi:FAD:protein FMN transferase [Rhodobacteraceae bacterium B1Z28]|uniref:FAD:protein FMN transferase n=1 Tax=Ruegeria haliotis TaxID=2747601 RepID=A0ABX2PLW5_9RHOB|nr:FAD:protein FMN transferase [Ruegeria haliotis]NVO54719.1 FAD:protein FMN transferase [Ruegeria haliotis]